MEFLSVSSHGPSESLAAKDAKRISEVATNTGTVLQQRSVSLRIFFASLAIELFLAKPLSLA